MARTAKTVKTTEATKTTKTPRTTKKVTKKEPDNEVNSKLKYIGLNLNRIPAFLKEHESLNFRPSKSYDDTIY